MCLQSNQFVGWAVEEEKVWRKSRFDRFPCINYYSSVFWLHWECCWLENHTQNMVRHLERLKPPTFECVQAFPMFGGVGVSMPSLHRESTDSLIMQRLVTTYVAFIIKHQE